MNRPAVGRFGAYALVVAVGAAGMWRVETTANQAETAAQDAQRALDELEADRLAAREANCAQKDEDNATLRRIGKDGPLEAVEAIIEIAGRPGADPPDPAVIDQLRQIEGRRLDGIVNTLPGWRWDPLLGRCIDIPLDTGR